MVSWTYLICPIVVLGSRQVAFWCSLKYQNKQQHAASADKNITLRVFILLTPKDTKTDCTVYWL